MISRREKKGKTKEKHTANTEKREKSRQEESGGIPD